jgi:hypothetical protein
MATDERRPIYLAASGVLNSPTFLSAILVGAVLEFVAAEMVFAAALGLSVAAAALAWSLPRSRSQANLGANAAAGLNEPQERPA